MVISRARATALHVREWLTPEVIEACALGDHACGKVSVRRPDGSFVGEAFDVIEGLARLVVLLEAANDACVDASDRDVRQDSQPRSHQS